MSIVVIVSVASVLDILVTMVYWAVRNAIFGQKMLKRRYGRHYTLKKGIMYELRSMINHIIAPK